MSNIKLPFKQIWWDVPNFVPLLHDQAFGFELDERLCIVPVAYPPRIPSEKYEEMDRILSSMDTGFSEVINNEEEFEVRLKVKPFRIENITVTAVEDFVKVLCEHPFVTEGKGEVTRRFKRIYAIPRDCNPYTLKAYLRSDGLLILNCKKQERGKERVIPVGLEFC